MPSRSKPPSKLKSEEVRFRVEPQLKRALELIAEAEYLEVSDLMRRELRRLVKENAHRIAI